MSDSEDTDDESNPACLNSTRLNSTEETDEICKERSGDVTAAVSDITVDLNNLTIVSPASSVCTFGICHLEKNKYMLECSKCKKLTHYACTQLPPYQVSLFMLKGYRLYVCRICVGEVDKDVITQCTSYLSRIIFKQF